MLRHVHRAQVLEQLSPVKLPSFMSPPRPVKAPSANASCARKVPGPDAVMEAVSPSRRQSGSARQKRKRDAAADHGAHL